MQQKKNIASIYDRINADNSSDDDQGISSNALKNFVRRDLLFLLNTTGYYYYNEAAEDNQLAYAKSVLNYGIGPISGRQVSEINWLEVEKNIKLAIALFEPRILQAGLEVKCLMESEGIAKHNQMRIEIKGLIRSAPYPERFLLMTTLDVETGSFISAI